MRNYVPTDLIFPKGKSYRPRVLADVYSKTLKHARHWPEYFIFNSYSLYLRSSSAIHVATSIMSLSVIANLCRAFCWSIGPMLQRVDHTRAQSQQTGMWIYIYIAQRYYSFDARARSFPAESQRTRGNDRKFTKVEKEKLTTDNPRAYLSLSTRLRSRRRRCVVRLRLNILRARSIRSASGNCWQSIKSVRRGNKVNARRDDRAEWSMVGPTSPLGRVFVSPLLSNSRSSTGAAAADDGKLLIGGKF